jgi:hypothetical protein
VGVSVERRGVEDELVVAHAEVTCSGLPPGGRDQLDLAECENRSRSEVIVPMTSHGSPSLACSTVQGTVPRAPNAASEVSRRQVERAA